MTGRAAVRRAATDLTEYYALGPALLYRPANADPPLLAAAVPVVPLPGPAATYALAVALDGNALAAAGTGTAGHALDWSLVLDLDRLPYPAAADRTTYAALFPPRAAAWEDLRFPAVGQRLEVVASRIELDYANVGVSYEALARYPNEFLMGVAQLPHAHVPGTPLHPHLHWVQAEAHDPNWLLAWRAAGNGQDPTGAWTLEVPETARLFTYSGGSLLQVTEFPPLPTAGLGLSASVEFKLYRDSANASGRFAGADPYLGAALLKELDLHYQGNGRGSALEDAY